MSKDKLDKQVKKILNNKTVHIEIPGEIHKKLRVKLFLDEISMQQFFRLVSEKYVNDDNQNTFFTECFYHGKITIIKCTLCISP